MAKESKDAKTETRGRKPSGGTQMYFRVPADVYAEIKREDRGNLTASGVGLMRDGMLWRQAKRERARKERAKKGDTSRADGPSSS